MKCPYCDRKLIGEEPNRVCPSTISCGAREVDTSDPNSYDKKFKKNKKKKKSLIRLSS